MVASDRPAKEEDAAEALIRQRIAAWANSVAARDLDAVLSFYAPDIVSFDLDPPLQYAGADRKRQAWQEFFAVHSRPIGYEVQELRLAIQGGVAFAHSLNHVRGTLASGQTSELWVRWTACLRKIDGLWQVVHDHVSVPADLKQGRAVVNLRP
jgi:uncharacterized protein (TIGR02246 family)